MNFVAEKKINTELITELSDLQALESEWNRLLSQSGSDTIFLTWEWITAWIKVSEYPIRPFVILVRDSAGTLQGLAPFYLSELRLLNAIPFKTLRIMGDTNSGAEYPDWIVHSERDSEIRKAIAAALLKFYRRWDCIWIPRMSGWTSGCEKIVDILKREGFFCHIRPSKFSSFELPTDIHTYIGMLSQNRRSQLRRQMRKVLGRNKVSLLKCRSLDALPGYLKTLFDLHHRRWITKGDPGGFIRRPATRRFYEEFTPAALRKGWLRFFALQDGDESKAIQIGYVYNKIFHQLQEGFNPDYVDGVGNVLRAKVIEACIEEGVRTYDFLGGMTEHKKRWSAKERTGHDLFIGHRKKIKDRILFAKEIWPSGRFINEQSNTN